MWIFTRTTEKIKELMSFKLHARTELQEFKKELEEVKDELFFLKYPPKYTSGEVYNGVWQILGVRIHKDTVTETFGYEVTKTFTIKSYRYTISNLISKESLLEITEKNVSDIIEKAKQETPE